MAIVAAVIALLCIVLRRVRALGGAAQPLRPGDAQPVRRPRCRRPGWTTASRRYLLGTDDQGRDILSALIYGARISLLVGLASVVLSMVVGVGLGLLSGFVGGKVDAFIMRVCDVMLSFPSILIALLIDGVGRAMFPNAHDTLAFGVLILAISLSRLGAVRAHGARLDAGRAQQGIRAGRARDRRLAVPHHGPARAAQRDGAGAGAGHDPGRRRPSSPRPRCPSWASACRRPQPSLGTLIRVGNDFLFSGEWWITIFPGAHAGADRAQREPARRLAARRAQPEAALKHGVPEDRCVRCPRSGQYMTAPLLEVRQPARRVPHAPRHAAGAGRHLLRHRARARSSAWSANRAPASRSPARRSSACSSRRGASPAARSCLDGRRIDNLPYEQMREHPRPPDRRHLPGPADLAEPAVHDRPPAHRDDPDAPAGRAPTRRASAPSGCCRKPASRRPSSASTSTRTSSPAACASAW